MEILLLLIQESVNWYSPDTPLTTIHIKRRMASSCSFLSFSTLVRICPRSKVYYLSAYVLRVIALSPLISWRRLVIRHPRVKSTFSIVIAMKYDQRRDCQSNMICLCEDIKKPIGCGFLHHHHHHHQPTWWSVALRKCPVTRDLSLQSALVILADTTWS